ncbi:glutamine--fructose-6-phosphate transaminase (isomerizing) [Bermanella marisrubri]|uniref:Glutamine--fructose-6-phosphate aminotransferase [isomerizing] n=1 Tax=Bermanella marisrubri TaxID=207949 RepID=Q1MZ63_9GAMM|nr:glutamine--fructose-6-phosphate transaminase (isomerizing) [Bermanella marisrubri]EAT11270.1 glucosamine--fructose-6-phosphate aminotransferase, isomerizing [Oceanobacter sp. RED65] [Bermanella marisrubri]QIZ82752.1 glutamine--fructose-6-phosphate transaminase (isomerizing) [Bermanella marisrubri]
MCGIVGGIAQRNVSEILLEGLRRLEYRGYDSAGLAAMTDAGVIERCRRMGKVKELEQGLADHPFDGKAGIAHTRWATHGKPSEVNAHPHMSGERLAIVHNGIIENHDELREQLKADGYSFTSQTDTEVIVHLLHKYLQKTSNLSDAVKETVQVLDGAYALGVISADHPGKLVAARHGSPLVIGVGSGEHFIASDQLALLQVTDRFIFLNEGDVAELTADHIHVWDKHNEEVVHDVTRFDHQLGTADKGEFRHYMMKEIYEQPDVIRQCLEGRVSETRLLEQAFGVKAKEVLDQTQAIQIIACGTSYHAGMVAKYWIESLAGIPCQVEVASEYRYRKTVALPNSLFITISQSGETADTLAALRKAKDLGFTASLTVCNVPGSSLVRESDLAIMTNAGPEIGVASTKAFTSQLTALMLLTIALGRRHGMVDQVEEEIIKDLVKLPELVEKAIALDDKIEKMSQAFAEKHNSLFLGRGAMFPIALEGSLKLKEISYIHAEAYPAGELKHGPLALVDKDMPIVTVAPHNDLLDKLKSNLEEVRARGGELFVFADEKSKVKDADGLTVLNMPSCSDLMEPILYIIPLQLLSYHVAVLKGTDVDQPRNLAKSVTVE